MRLILGLMVLLFFCVWICCSFAILFCGLCCLVFGVVWLLVYFVCVFAFEMWDAWVCYLMVGILVIDLVG